MRALLALLATLVLALPAAAAAAAAPADPAWAEVLVRARGQTVYLNAWGGSGQINDYLAWAGEETLARYGVRLVQVKLGDTSEAVARVLAERTAGRTSGGSVDLVWINGENFRAMREAGLLGPPFVADLPNAALVDWQGKPTTRLDFTIPTEGLESPWGMAQLVVLHDAAAVPEPPRTALALLAWAEAHPGRLTYPAPPDFIGTTFLKQLLYATIPDPARLQQPVEPEEFAQLTGPLWQRLDQVRPHLWRGGRTFPGSGQVQHQLLDAGEVDFSLAFNPAEASSLILAGRLPESVRCYVPDGGSIANTHFVAIPFNAAHREGALVVADFLLSPEAQARKQDVTVWGDPTVLDLAALDETGRARFAALPHGPADLPPEALAGTSLPEPHPFWTELLKRGWAERYAP